MNKLKPLITSRGCAMSAWRNRHRLIHQARASSFTTFIASPMDGSVSTSVSSVRTVYQSHSQHLAESAEGSQSRRDTRDNVPGAAAHSTGEGSSSTYGNADYTEKSAMSSHYSGVMVSAPSSPRMHALVLPSPPDSPGGSPSSSVDDASESSLPSVSSSFFFSSSAAGSPGRSHPSSYPSSHPQSDHEHDHDHDQDHDHQGRHHRRVHEQGLIIPSLSLPDALRRPTPFGQTLGDIRILVLGRARRWQELPHRAAFGGQRRCSGCRHMGRLERSRSWDRRVWEGTQSFDRLAGTAECVRPRALRAHQERRDH